MVPLAVDAEIMVSWVSVAASTECVPKAGGMEREEKPQTFTGQACETFQTVLFSAGRIAAPPPPTSFLVPASGEDG